MGRVARDVLRVLYIFILFLPFFWFSLSLSLSSLAKTGTFSASSVASEECIACPTGAQISHFFFFKNFPIFLSQWVPIVFLNNTITWVDWNSKILIVLSILWIRIKVSYKIHTVISNGRSRNIFIIWINLVTLIMNSLTFFFSCI